MLSHHLAELYGVETRALVQAVRRNIDRFPEDFMFQLADEEFANLKSQIVISSWGGSLGPRHAVDPQKRPRCRFSRNRQSVYRFLQPTLFSGANG